jgi:hypothetical protein
LDSSIPAFAGIWQATKQPAPFTVWVNATDGNGVSASSAFVFTITVVDKSIPILILDDMNALSGVVQEPVQEIMLRINVSRAIGETYIRSVILYYATTAPASNSLAAWAAVPGVQTLAFSRIEGDLFVATLPGQAPSTQLHWAVYVEDYAGNNNNVTLDRGDGEQLLFAPDIIETIKPYMGFAFLGLIGFGIIFSISFRINQSVKSVKKAKKVSAAVKKAVPSKTAPGSKKTPISKDIPTKFCPICKAKIAADSVECPYCHKKF